MITRKSLAAFIVSIHFAALFAVGAERTVSNAADIAAARDAKPGDVLVMKDGSWKDQDIIFTAKGTADQPITLRAQTPGKVILEGDSNVVIDGEHMVVSGLFFTDSPSKKDAFQIKGTDNRVTESAIVAPNRAGVWFHFMGGQRNRMDHCYVEGHSPVDVRVIVEVEKEHPGEHHIDHNFFGPRSPLGANFGETIRVGRDVQSMWSSKTVVEDNLFERCDGEIEIISSKSCDNIYRHNTFRNSDATLTLRHGDRATVDGNFFLGNPPGGKPTGGIRVVGNDHTIVNNYFENTAAIAGATIVLTNGIPDSPLAGYWQIKKALIKDNIFVHNTGPIFLLNAGEGQKGRTLLPENVRIEGNILVPREGDQTPLVAGKQGKGFQWSGNKAQQGAVVGSAGKDGIELADLKMTRGQDGIMRPANAPAGAIKPLTAADDVGPAWRKQQGDAVLAAAKETAPIELKNDKLTVRVEPDARHLTITTPSGWGAESVKLCPEICNAGGVATRNVEYKDALGTAQSVEFESEGGLLRIWVYKDQPFVFARATMRAAGATNSDLRTVIPISYQLQTASLSLDKMKLFGSDGLSAATRGKPSYVFLAAVDPATNAGTVAGWITHDRASGIVNSQSSDGKLTFDMRSEYGLPALPGGKEERGETFVIGFFPDAHDGLEQFADATAKANNIKLPEPPCGYSTWYHARALDQERMAKLAVFCKENRLNEYGLNFLQIDDGWQISRRDFTTHKPKGPYPDGMKKTAENITSHGFTAGIWLTPFGWQGRDDHPQRMNGDYVSTPNESALKDHPDWFVHRADGSVYDVFWAWDCLDMSNPQARDFLKDVVSRMTHDWGYKVLKIDGLWAGMACKILYPEPTYRDDGLGDAVFYDKNKTNVEVYRDGLKLVHEAAGKDVFLLGCNIAQNMRTLGASIGLVEAMRIGPDIKADWGAVVRCARPATRLYFWNGKVWYNDPDCLMLRDPLTVANGQAWGSFIALSGQLNLVSEWLPDLPKEKLDIYKRTIPNHRAFTARPVDLFERDMAQVWHVHAGEGEGRMDVVGLFNWNAGRATTRPSSGPEEPTTQAAARLATGPVKVVLDPSKLGLPEGQYVGFDYWGNKFIPAFSGKQDYEIPAGSCMVISLRRKMERPQLLSTSRHVSQGIMDVAGLRWDADRKVLSGKSKVIGGDEYELRINSAGMNASPAKAQGAQLTQSQDGQDVRVTLNSPMTAEIAWEIPFAAP